MVASSDWDGSYYSIPGHAEGTNNAPPGWSWVGEEGPELMWMHGGEQILPNSVSQQVVRDYNEYQEYAAKDAPPEFSDGVSQERAVENQGVQQESHPLEVIGTGSTETGRAKVDIHLHIGAGALPETVSAWQEYAGRGELKAVFLEMLEEADADMKRWVMG